MADVVETSKDVVENQQQQQHGDQEAAAGEETGKKQQDAAAAAAAQLFDKEHKDLVDEARALATRFGADAATVVAVSPCTGERHVTRIGGAGVQSENYFADDSVRRALRVKGRLGADAVRMLSEEFGGGMRLVDVQKLVDSFRALRLGVARRIKARKVAAAAELDLVAGSPILRSPAKSPESGMKLVGYLLSLGSSIMNRREAHTFELVMA